MSLAGTGGGTAAPALLLVTQTFKRGALKLLSGVSMSEPCSGGGTATFSGEFKNENTLSDGDSITIKADNCVEGGDAINGTMSFVASGVSGTFASNGVWGATLDAKFTGFSVTLGGTNDTATGDMKMVIKQNSLTDMSVAMSGKSLQTSQSKGGVTLFALTLADYSGSANIVNSTLTSAANYSLSGNTSKLGQFTYAVKNLKPFVGPVDAAPTSGSSIINGDLSSVTMTAIGNNQVRLDYSAKGDSEITQTKTVTWAELEASH